MGKPHKKGGVPNKQPCSSRPECRHAKHGYTRKDRPGHKAAVKRSGWK